MNILIMKKNEEFSLTGITRKKKGKWGCIITLKTPDGRETTLESDYKFTETEAQRELKQKIEEVLIALGSECGDIEIVGRTEVRGGKLVQ
jgi:hypothetical protein